MDKYTKLIGQRLQAMSDRLEHNGDALPATHQWVQLVRRWIDKNRVDDDARNSINHKALAIFDRISMIRVTAGKVGIITDEELWRRTW